MKIKNYTDYETRDLRGFFLRGLKAMNAKSDKVIEVRPRSGRFRCSRAVVGTLIEYQSGAGRRWQLHEARWIRMLVYENADGTVNMAEFARTFEHEVLHSKGARHGDMTAHQMACDLSLPDWAVGLEVRRRAPKPQPTREAKLEMRVAARAERARALLATYEAKQKRVAKLVTKWRTKVRYYDRRAAAKSGGS
jgi:hypothetical protein